MGQINRIPNGFLDLVGVQSLGKNPPLYSDAVSPTVDLTDFYLAQTLSAHSEVFQHGSEGDQVVHFVPEGETWLLIGVSMWRIVTTSGDKERWAWFIDSLPREETPAGTTVEPIIWRTRSEDELTSASDACVDSHVFERPIPLLNGVALKARVFDRSGATRTTELTWLFHRLKN